MLNRASARASRCSVFFGCLSSKHPTLNPSKNLWYVQFLHKLAEFGNKAQELESKMQKKSLFCIFFELFPPY